MVSYKKVISGIIAATFAMQTMGFASLVSSPQETQEPSQEHPTGETQNSTNVAHCFSCDAGRARFKLSSVGLEARGIGTRFSSPSASRM